MVRSKNQNVTSKIIDRHLLKLLTQYLIIPKNYK